MKNLVILTGAGISAESGISTFRDEGGLWCNHRIEDVATPEGFARDPKLVQDFYNMRRAQLKDVHPNAAHHALAELAAAWPGKFLLVTQNVDDLHDRALSKVKPREGFKLIHMHGILTRVHCTETLEEYAWTGDVTTQTECPCCDGPFLRPHIVWFGEMPLEMPTIYKALAGCDLFVSIGTSGQVYPAAGFVSEAARAGARTVEINLEPSAGYSMFDEHHHGKAGDLVPPFVAQLLAQNK